MGLSGYFNNNEQSENTLRNINGEYELEPIADAHVSSILEDNFGGHHRLELYRCGSSEEIVYLKFDLSDIPKDSKVDYAELSLYCEDVGYYYDDPPIVCIYECSDTSWDEDEINYSNAPYYNDDDPPITCEIANRLIYWENNWTSLSGPGLINYIQNAIGSNVTLVLTMLYTGCGGSIWFRSKEGASLLGKYPKLDIKMEV